MLMLADTWADAATLIAVVVSVAAVLIVAMLCGWKPWTRPSFWDLIHGEEPGGSPRGESEGERG